MRIANEVRWVTGPLEHLWLQVQLTGTDQWAMASADPQVPLTKPDQRRRFTSPDKALYFAEQSSSDTQPHRQTINHDQDRDRKIIKSA